MKAPETPWVAAVLALALGGPGCFYLGWRRGAKATLAWLFAFCFILLGLLGPPLLEPAAFFILVVHASLAWKAYRSCKRSNAEVAKAAGIAIPGTARDDGVTRKTGRKPLTGWKCAAWVLSKSVLRVVGAIGLIIALFLTYFGLVDWHYRRMQRSVRSGMTIEEVLHTVQESGQVNGYSLPLGAEERALLYGPQDGTYFHHDLATNQNEKLSEGQAAALLRQNMIPGREYSIGFIATSRYGPHVWLTVILNPEGRVKEVRPFHTWD